MPSSIYFDSSDSLILCKKIKLLSSREIYLFSLQHLNQIDSSDAPDDRPAVLIDQN